MFFGTGAYTVAIAAQDWHVTGDMEFALLPLAGLTAGLVAVPFGLIALRVRRHTFVVVTIAVFFIFQLMAFDFGFTGGSVGLSAPFLTWAPQTFNNPFYYVALGLAAGTGVLAWLIHGSRFGLQLRAIRDDEDRARGLGVRVMPVKLTAFVISGVVTGLVGAVWFFFIGQVLPQYGFDPLFDLSVALMTFFGGFGTLGGAGARSAGAGAGPAVPHPAREQQLCRRADLGALCSCWSSSSCREACSRSPGRSSQPGGPGAPEPPRHRVRARPARPGKRWPAMERRWAGALHGEADERCERAVAGWRACPMRSAECRRLTTARWRSGKAP